MSPPDHCAADPAKITYCERFVEFLIDLISQLPTRRFFRTLLEDSHVIIHCRLAPLYKMPEGSLFKKLIDILKFYQGILSDSLGHDWLTLLGFEINDFTGEALTDNDMISLHYSKMQNLQVLALLLSLSLCGVCV